MKDGDIRTILHNEILVEHQSDPSTVVVDELSILQGTVRIDIAVVNGQLQGYEIKSEADTLERLSKQSECYSRVFDRLELVVSDKHIDKAVQQIPEWWGVLVASNGSDGKTIIEPYRDGEVNPNVEPRAVAELLWKNEALVLLAERGADKGVKSRPRNVVWDRLCQVYEPDEIREAVRTALKGRLAQRSVTQSL